MKGFLEKIENTDFRKPAKRLILITLVVVLLCGAVTGYLLRTQISELSALKDSDVQTVQPSQVQPSDGRAQRGEDAEHDRDREERGLIESGLLTPPSAAARASAIVSVVLCGLCALACWLTVAAWLYKASSKAGMNRALWSILGLCLNLPAVLAFLIVRGRMARCPDCGAWQKAAPYCAACGAKLQLLCPRCGRICSIRDDFCRSCGAPLKDKAAEAAHV